MKKLWLILFCLSIALCFAHSSYAYENVNQGCLACHPEGAIGAATPPQLHGIVYHRAAV